MTPDLGVGMLGGGFMAAVHSRAARAAGARLVGLVSGDAEQTAQAVAELGFERGYASLAELLADPAIDVVHVCTPNVLHYEQAMAVIDAGKHVICEKPLAVTAEQADELVRAAADAGVIAAVPFAYRFHPLVREARARVQAGELGQLTMVNGTYLQDWLLSAMDNNWRVDAKFVGPSRVFADIGSHLVDLIEFITGDRIETLTAVKQTVFPTREGSAVVTTEDAVALSVMFRSGAIGTLAVSQVVPGQKNRLRVEIAGTEAALEFDQEDPEKLWLHRRSHAERILREAAYLSPDAARLCRVPSGHPMGFQDAFNSFVADVYTAIETGCVPDGLPTFADGLRAARLTEAAMAAADSGRWVALNPNVADLKITEKVA